jgi:hypothetical protein
LLSCSPPTAFAADITINQTVKYYDEKIIAAKIKSERVTLGPKLVASTEAAVQKNGWSVIKKDVVDGTGNGVNLKLTITNAHSSGNAFIGHHKSVGIMTELFKDGKLIDTYTGERNSSGGFGAGFKGPCAVLERCANTLGKDVSEWLSKQKI